MCKSYSKSSIILLLCPTLCWGLVIPTSPTNVEGGDEIRARDGTSCRQGTHQGATFDTGVSGGRSGNDLSSIADKANAQATAMANDVGLYARVIIPISNDEPRMDCTRLYDLEVQRMELELEKLKNSGKSSVVVE